LVGESHGKRLGAAFSRLALVSSLSLLLAPAVVGAATEVDSPRRFSDTEIPFHKLTALGSDVVFAAGEFILDELRAMNISARIRQVDGIRVVENAHAQLAGGRIDFNVRIEVNGEVPRVQVLVSGQEILLGELGGSGTRGRLLSGGKSRFKLRIEGEGKSVREILASANGNFILISGAADLPTLLLNSGVGLISGIFRVLLPIGETVSASRLRCASVDLNIVHGVALSERGIVLQTEKQTLTGSGAIDLGSERLSLTFEVRNRAGIDIASGALASVVEVGGTLNEPRLQVDAEAVVKGGVSLGATLATEGFSRLAEILYKKGGTSIDECADGLEFAAGAGG